MQRRDVHTKSYSTGWILQGDARAIFMENPMSCCFFSRASFVTVLATTWDQSNKCAPDWRGRTWKVHASAWKGMASRKVRAKEE